MAALVAQAMVSAQAMLKEMEVCDICGAFLVVGDAPQRVQEHLEGKQHIGYARCRDTIEDLKVVFPPPLFLSVLYCMFAVKGKGAILFSERRRGAYPL